MAAYARVRLGRPSDVQAMNDVVAAHKTLKQEVVQVLKDLAEKAEGLVIEQVEGEMKSTFGKMVGRGIVLVSGIASIFLLPATGLGAAVGISGVVVGYVVLGGSKLFEMRCSKEQAKKMRDIYDKVRHGNWKMGETSKTDIL